MCAAAGWYEELTERGFLQELRIDCVHVAAPKAKKELRCMQCELYKSRDAYKTQQWKKVRAGDRLCIMCEDLNAAASVTHAATTGEHGALGGQSAAGAGQFAHSDTHAPTPGEHGALGGQSAAGAGAAACDVGAGADACFQRRCLGLAAPMHAPVVLRVSAFNVAAFNQNMCMRSGMSNVPTNAFGC
jgi:hypothetical protein